MADADERERREQADHDVARDAPLADGVDDDKLEDEQVAAEGGSGDRDRRPAHDG